MPNRSSTELLRARVAYLASGNVGGNQCTQAQILERIPELRSQSSVSRLLTEAKRAGYIEMEPRYVQDKVPTAIHRQVLAAEGEGKLGELIRREAKRREWAVVPQVHLIPMTLSTKPSEDNLRRFFDHVAQIVRDLLQDVKLCGVAWGATLFHVVEALTRSAQIRHEKYAHFRAIPLIGEARDRVLNRYSSTSLAEVMQTALRGTPPAEPISLNYVHAFISEQLETRRGGMDEAYEDFREDGAFGEIFPSRLDTKIRENSKALVLKLQALLTSVSAEESPWGVGDPEVPRLHARVPRDEESLLNRVREVAIADIGGVLLPQGTLDKPGQRKLSELQRRWTGITPDQLCQTARRAAQPGSGPGVICIAFGPHKVKACASALQAGYINHLVVGERLASALETYLKSIGAR